MSWAYHPKALPLAVPASTLNMAVLRGMHVTILRPNEFQLPESVMDKARLIASDTGAKIEETTDIHEAMSDANIIYAKSWVSQAIMKISRKKIKYGLNIKTGVFQSHGLKKLKNHAVLCTVYLSEGESW